MSTGLIALLDDLAGLAKIAATTLDDAAAQSARAGVKAAGLAIDDAAVTPGYVVGFSASRELPIVRRIAVGSVKNKLLYLLPAALALSAFLPWAITPLLMLGGLYLCYEGAEKVYEALWPDQAHDHEAKVAAAVSESSQALEDAKVKGAIATDFILSAEIMAITLSTVPDASFWMQAVVLAIVGLGVTVAVYGGVALIVKADDAGLSLAENKRPVSSGLGVAGPGRPGARASAADRVLRPLTQGLGRGVVIGMPWFLRALSIVGTAAMVWVGGGIIVHGLEEYGLTALSGGINDLAAAVARAVPVIAGLAAWVATAAASGVVGLLVGAPLIPVVEHVAAPALKRIRGLRVQGA